MPEVRCTFYKFASMCVPCGAKLSAVETNVQEKAISRKRPGFFGDVKDNGLYSLLNIILFSVLAEAAYVAVLFLTDVLKRCMDGDAFSFAVFIINPFLFNILC